MSYGKDIKKAFGIQHEIGNSNLTCVHLSVKFHEEHTIHLDLKNTNP